MYSRQGPGFVANISHLLATTSSTDTPSIAVKTIRRPILTQLYYYWALFRLYCCMGFVSRRALVLLLTLGGVFFFFGGHHGFSRRRVPTGYLDRYLLGFTDEPSDAENYQIPQAGVVPPGTLPKVVDHRVAWKTAAELPQTALVRHVPGKCLMLTGTSVTCDSGANVVAPTSFSDRIGTGFTVLENLYAHNGTFYIITDKADEFPPIRDMISSGFPMLNETEDATRVEPTDNDMRIVTPERAVQLFGTTATYVGGVSVSDLLESYCVFSQRVLRPPQFVINDPEDCMLNSL